MSDRRSGQKLLPTFVTAKVMCLTITLGMERVVRVDGHSTDWVFHLVVFVKADTFDVVPCGCQMADEALIHLGLFHASGGHRNHFEVHHVMARRGLVTLSAVLGCGRGMAEFGNGPFRGRVALRAVLTE